MKIRSSAAAVLVCAGTLCPVAGAQVISWNNASGGVWSNPANWDPQNVPDTAAESAVIALPGTYSVAYNLSAGLGGLTVSNAGATVGISNAAAMLFAGTAMPIDGRLVVNAESGGSFTQLRFDANTLISGAGRLSLNANPNLDTAVVNTNGTTFTVAPGFIVDGTGKINGAMVNNGLVHANTAGRTLELGSSAKTNNATMRASGGGVLSFNSVGVTQDAAGVIEGVGGPVSMLSAAISGGAVRGGTLSPVGLSGTCNFTNVTTAGEVGVNNASALLINGAGLRNDGTLTVNVQAGGSFTQIRADSDALLSGGGALVLNANPNLDTAVLNTNGTTLTHAAGHTIRGTGKINATLINNGAITADVNGRTIQLTVGPKTNNSVMSAFAGGTLDLNTVTVTQGAGSGRILANGGTVSIAGSAITNGRVESADASSPVSISGTCTFTDVRLSGPAAGVNNGSLLLVRGAGLNNTGTLTVNPQAGGSATFIRFDESGSFTGAGQVLLNANPNIDTAYLQTNGTTFTNASPHLIRGTGRIYGAMVNNSEVRADQSARVLELLSAAKTNNGLLNAVNNGILSISGVGVTQDAANGRIRANGGTVSIAGSAITNGRVESADASSPVSISGTCTFTDVRLSGPAIGIANASSVLVAGAESTLTNDATLTINQQAGGSATQVRFDAAGITVAGTGVVRLNANANLDTAFLNLSVASVTFGTGQTIAGRGRMFNGFYDIRGTLSPGFGATPVDQIDFSGAAPRFTPTSALEIDITGVGAGQFDRITTGGRAAVLDGVVRVRRLNGFVPATCVSLPIMTTPAGNTGRFLRVEGDTGNPDRKWRIFNSGTQILLTSACLADFNADCTTDFNDLLEYLNLYNAQDPEADLDGDGAIDFNDFLAFLNLYTGGCP
jgi:hypothetical protein